MDQTLPTCSVVEPRDAPHTSLLSDETFEQLYDLVGLFRKQPVFTHESELILIVTPKRGAYRCTKNATFG